MAPFGPEGMTEQEIQVFMEQLPRVIKVHEKVQAALHLVLNGKETIANLKAAVLQVTTEELLRGHSFLNRNYRWCLEYISCPWVRKLFPQSLAVQDMMYWFDQAISLIPDNVPILSTIKHKINPAVELDEEELAAFEASRRVEPMELKRGHSRTLDGDHDGFMTSTGALLNSGLKMIQMSIILGSKTPFF